MRHFAFTLLLFFVSLFSFAQKKPATPSSKPTINNAPKPVVADCSKAIKINVSPGTAYGVTTTPKGFGELQEFKAKSKLTFEEEHNSAWYLLTIGKEGELVFDITPQDTTNDYDFLLYNYTDSAFCDALHKNKFKPIRSNLSNIKRSIKGVTGLQANTDKNTIGEGVGIAFSNSIDVKKGDQYMLILDNVTPEGKGHTIRFYFLKDVEIKGKVINSDSVAVEADITISDNNGNTVLETKSDKNGNYKINTSLRENQNYSFSIISENTFPDVKTINTKTHKDTNDIRVMLPKLKKGEKYKLGNINFFGNSDILLPESKPSAEALYKLMKKNKSMTITIQGHVNDPGSRSKAEQIQLLSDARAKTVYYYLINKGIDKTRMKTEGLSNKKMLFPNPKNEYEEGENRRVEIKVMSL